MTTLPDALLFIDVYNSLGTYAFGVEAFLRYAFVIAPNTNSSVTSVPVNIQSQGTLFSTEN